MHSFTNTPPGNQTWDMSSLGLPGEHSFLSPRGTHTLHQRAFLFFWLSALLLWAVKSLVRALHLQRHFNKNQEHIKIATVENGLTANPAKHESNSVPDVTEKEQVAETEKEHKPATPASDRLPFGTFLKSIALLGAIMFYFYICDYDHFFPAGTRVYSRDVFVFLYLVLMVVAVCFTTRECKDKILNRDQTEEWKGIMQVLFVWYHYFKAAETYNAIRVFIAAYVWMTGFGNFSFFWIRQDFSLYRMLKMLFRLNFLVVITCIVTTNEYMLYYICPMHTFWFLSVYAMMRPLYKRNADPKVMAAKFGIYFVLVFLIFDVSGVGEMVFKPFYPILSYRKSLHEWMFRAGLDHYATFLGMLCAYFYPNFEKFMSSLELEVCDRKTQVTHLLVKFGIAAALVTSVGFWWCHVFVLPKFDYNKLHPYYSCIPLLAYIYLRNILPSLRTRYIHMFCWLGRITLETYISQLHVYLQADAKMLIVYIPGYPLLNFALATVIYLCLSYTLFHLTVDLSAYLIPKDFKLMGKRLIMGCGWFVGCYLCAAVFLVSKPSTTSNL
ncbi:protein REDUCED WALL ACETYLATION 3 isoform X2 [Nematostella vectensis]|uniref:protein REDUCED WALL ACETYLATION 3 isoform X2 n=1 Tax=Nematostella vectensis TaxID=45351 RepID=UPI0020776529|nr:protein REDUCED WALL ACETYLATION 3 isoform X2 [Nematostella vectensis]